MNRLIQGSIVLKGNQNSRWIVFPRDENRIAIVADLVQRLFQIGLGMIEWDCFHGPLFQRYFRIVRQRGRGRNVELVGIGDFLPRISGETLWVDLYPFSHIEYKRLNSV